MCFNQGRWDGSRLVDKDARILADGAMMPAALATFRAVRAALDTCRTRRAAALFDRIDALLTAEPVPSPVHLRATLT